LFIFFDRDILFIGGKKLNKISETKRGNNIFFWLIYSIAFRAGRVSLGQQRRKMQNKKIAHDRDCDKKIKK